MTIRVHFDCNSTFISRIFVTSKRSNERQFRMNNLQDPPDFMVPGSDNNRPYNNKL